jgi:transposase-like protein
MLPQIRKTLSRRRTRRREYNALTDPMAARWAAQRNLDAPTIAQRIGVPMHLFRQWMRQYPDFAAAVTEGQRTADETVIQALHKRAAGYEFENADITIIEDGKKTVEKIVKKKSRRHLPPSVWAATFWVKNRLSDQWGDKPVPPPREIIARIRPIRAIMPKPALPDATHPRLSSNER